MERAFPYYRLSHQSRSPAHLDGQLRPSRRAGQALSGFGGDPPRAAAAGQPSRRVRASLWLFGGGQAGSSCRWSRASGVREVGVGVDPPLPATCLLPGPLPPEQESQARACGPALRRSSNPPLGSELKVQGQQVLECKGTHPWIPDSSFRTARWPTLVAVGTRQPGLTQTEGARPWAALGRQGPSPGETGVQHLPGGTRASPRSTSCFPFHAQRAVHPGSV